MECSTDVLEAQVEHLCRAPDTAEVVRIKMISRLLPYHVAENSTVAYRSREPVIIEPVLKIDLGTHFWSRCLDRSHLLNSLHALRNSDPKIKDTVVDFHRMIIDSLPLAKKIFASSSLPRPDQLWFCYRTFLHCSRLSSRACGGYSVHLSRGYITEEYDQFSIKAILDASLLPLDTSFGREVSAALEDIDMPQNGIFVLNIRNDGELNQALLTAGLIKRYAPNCTTILETAGGNEQFDFSQWRKLFSDRREALGKVLDYFVPQQDFGTSMRKLIAALRVNPNRHASSLERNIISLSTPKLTEAVGIRFDTHDNENEIRNSFRDFVKSSPVVVAGGLKTIFTRLLADRCHWSACRFCTINSQHILPRGTDHVTTDVRESISRLIDHVRRQEIRSIVLLDEAIAPDVLLHFAKVIIDQRIEIVYRARARFTEELSVEAAKLLFRSGCRYLGLGLEAKSDRVNRLVNKQRGSLPDFQKILDNLDQSGIRPHVYCIMALPTETVDEIQETKNFIATNIERLAYCTVSANTFFLMKGSSIARNPTSYGLEINESEDSVKLALDYAEDDSLERREAAARAAASMYQQIFSPHMECAEDAANFWHFVDQTGFFYLQKVMHRENPYRTWASCIDAAYSAKDIEDLYSRSFSLRKLETPGDRSKVLLIDIATFCFASVSQRMAEFVLQYPDKGCLEICVRDFSENKKESDAVYEGFWELLRAGLFVPAKYINEVGNPNPFVN